MIFVQALRLHLDESRGVGWLFALSDKHVGAAIAAIHREPARRWTVAALAARSRHVAIRFRGAICGNWSAMDRSNISRVGGCCSPAAAYRGANPSAPSPVRSGYEFGKRLQHCLQARDGQAAPPSRAPGGRGIGGRSPASHAFKPAIPPSAFPVGGVRARASTGRKEVWNDAAGLVTLITDKSTEL